MTKPRYTGTLNDDEINKFCSSNVLISENFNAKNIKQACYELRASEIYYDLDQPNKPIDLSKDGYSYILIKPKQSVVIITFEHLNIPDYIISRILTKGKLFSIGLLPVNTYADPGFEGQLGIILYNSSSNYIKINPEDSIAKIEFSVLKNSVSKPYKSQHGYQTKIWPIPHSYILEEKDLKSDARIGDTHSEIVRIYGKKYSKVISRLLNVERKLILATIVYFTFSLLLLGITILIDKTDLFSPFYTIILGLVTNIISFYVIYFLDKNKND
ncbi:hypothetical protein DS884_03660 [Tenacibaculum sp. E3R01]|uniref:dCTP deaminase domain-containing protein n=1 Tax=Tenacibaculum sp. E3R01 TaxID=2267227 RepID=UPI000DE82A23|nr:hypothetical protein [Tenacibaculum sp. E3R01]RBW61416.1 hypothetical protein DS884_03660 [Tenacibaculum sp. E3R01]